MGYDKESFASRFKRKQKYRSRDKNELDKVSKKRNSFYKKRLQEEEIEDLEEEIYDEYLEEE